MLKNIEIDSYFLDTIAFARTVVIKCREIALLDNSLMEKHLKIKPPKDESKWRYYLNLNGEYHETDEVMRVISLDNNQEIDFTKENLTIHLATKRAYRLGGYHYTRLSDKYPHQTTLINGIINPIPPSESIPAKDYQILRYNKDYVLWNEYDLIPELQRMMYAEVNSRFKTEYTATDNLMLPMLYAHMHSIILRSILDIRARFAETRSAHEFYIWSKLTSLGLDKRYKRFLDRKQTMWLYRNLESVIRNQGQVKTFEQLVDIILTHKRIPIVRYEYLQTTTDQLTEFRPNPNFISLPVNMLDDIGYNIKIHDVPSLIRKEIPLAIDNHEVINESIEEASFSIRNSQFASAPTKVLESVVTDVTDHDPDTIMKVLHNNLIYLTYQGLYDIIIDVTDARTGKRIRLNTKDAIVLWHYLIALSRGERPRELPEYMYWNARKIIPPTYLELMNLGDNRILTAELCKDILKVDVDFERIISPDVFYAKCKEIFDGMWDHKKLASRVKNLHYYTETKNACDSCYETGLAKLSSAKTYDEWLAGLDLDFTQYTDVEALDLAWSIWKRVTGWEFVNYITLGDQQRSLLSLMRDLSSYTVQYIGITEVEDGMTNVSGPMLIDGDHLDNNGKTELDGSENDLYLLPGLKGIPEGELVAKEVTGKLPPSMNGISTDAYLEAETFVDNRLYLFVPDLEEDASEVILTQMLMVKDCEDGTSNQNV